MAKRLGFILDAITLLTSLASEIMWAADQIYVIDAELDKAFMAQRLQYINDQLEELQLKVQLDMATVLDKARAERLEHAREEVLIELQSE